MRLRGEFIKRVGVSTHARDRFVWDFWHVPDQYRLLRTPAIRFFPSRLYSQFHQQLAWWGRTNLGCHDISPIWLSAYVDGCFQKFHGDLPHGPFAFVYSLTDWEKREFAGGETLLFKDSILDYWRQNLWPEGLESNDILERIPPRFGRLTVFDPRIPHGVEEVRNALGLSDARVVLHGWFIQPRPYIQGPMETDELAACLRPLPMLVHDAIGELSDSAKVRGVLTLRVKVSARGKAKTQPLVHTLRGLRPAETKRFINRVLGHFDNWSFVKKRAASQLTIPLNFS